LAPAAGPGATAQDSPATRGSAANAVDAATAPTAARGASATAGRAPAIAPARWSAGGRQRVMDVDGPARAGPEPPRAHDGWRDSIPAPGVLTSVLLLLLAAAVAALVVVRPPAGRGRG
jgi:hypothetical protein